MQVTFLSYLKSNSEYFSLIERKVREYCQSEQLGYAGFEVPDLTAERCGDMKIQFDLYTDIFHKNDDKTRAYILCSAKLGEKLENFGVLRIDSRSHLRPYNSRYANTAVDGFMLSHISRDDYDYFAGQILSKYSPESMSKCSPVNIELILKNMGYEIEQQRLTSNGAVRAVIRFDLSSTSGMKSGCVQYDPLSFSQFPQELRDALVNMTLAHECIHGFYHKETVAMLMMLNGEEGKITCQTEFTPQSNTSVKEWMEIQANGIAPHILMPIEQFRKKANSILSYYGILDENEKCNDTEFLHNIKKAIMEIANFYNVTCYDVRKRLIDIGFWQAFGAYNFGDRGNVRPYLFHLGALDYDETYTIRAEDVYDVMKHCEEYQNGFLIYAENHICVNKPEFVFKDKDTLEWKLTDTALRNIDECCIKFKCGYKNSSNPIFDGIIDNYLFHRKYERSYALPLDFDVKCKNMPDYMKKKEGIEEYRRHLDAVSKEIRIINGKTFPDAIEYLRGKYGGTTLQIATEIGMSERNLNRYLRDSNDNGYKQPTKNIIIGIVRFFDLNPKLSEAVIERGVHLYPDNPEDMEIKRVLCEFRKRDGYTPSDINRHMEDLNFKPIYSDLS